MLRVSFEAEGGAGQVGPLGQMHFILELKGWASATSKQPLSLLLLALF